MSIRRVSSHFQPRNMQGYSRAKENNDERKNIQTTSDEQRTRSATMNLKQSATNLKKSAVNLKKSTAF
ncbi:hypothetical protein D1115_10705 [Vibrio alfacsensis]|uniref:Uncharacterized protein n=1 Tax=Vibrio alfacsensis TaxID=1074311 RepID=A0ABN5PGX0_9VIBR|nr:hypothetical protein D1115_10705 [Vibrio alfacsensis]